MFQTWWDGFQLFCWMVGAGGIPTVVAAWFGRKRAQETKAPAPPAPVAPIEVASPWLVQNLLEIKLIVEAIHKDQDAIVASVNAMAVQINALTAKLRIRKTK